MLETFGRIDRSKKTDKPTATVGSYIIEAAAVAKVKDSTFSAYAQALRIIAAEIVKFTPTAKRYGKKGSQRWREKINAIPLSEITPLRVAKWQKKRLKDAGDDTRKQRSARESANRLPRPRQELVPQESQRTRL